MSKLHVVRLKDLHLGTCAVCDEDGLHMHADFELAAFIDGNGRDGVDGQHGRAGLVCQECASHLKSAEIELRAWVQNPPALHVYQGNRPDGRYYNSPRAAK